MREYIRWNKVCLVGLVKTKVKAYKFEESYTRFAKGWAYLNNYNCVDNGRIWLIWKAIEVYVFQ